MSAKTERLRTNSKIHVSKLQGEIYDLQAAITNQKSIKWTFLKTKVDEYFDELRLQAKRNRLASRSQSVRPVSSDNILKRRIVNARDLGNVYSAKNRESIPLNRSQSMAVSPAKQSLIDKGRQYGQLMSSINLQRLKSVSRRDDVKAAMANDYDAGWLDRFDNPNESVRIGKYYNNVTRILRMENKIDQLMECYGETAFTNDYLDLVRECYTFERHHKNVLKFAHHRMEAIERHFLNQIQHQIENKENGYELAGRRRSDLEVSSIVDRKIIRAINGMANELGFLQNYSKDRFEAYLNDSERLDGADVKDEIELKAYCENIAAELDRLSNVAEQSKLMDGMISSAFKCL